MQEGKIVRRMRVLALVAILFTASVAAECYLPDGSIAYGDTPCGTTLPAKCCEGTCLDNGLCFNPSVNLLSRSSCTDQTWTAPECTTTCKTVNPGAFEVVLPCGGGTFCCPPSSDSSPDSCCFNVGGTFKLESGNITVNTVADIVPSGTISASTESARQPTGLPLPFPNEGPTSDGQVVVTSISISISTVTVIQGPSTTTTLSEQSTAELSITGSASSPSSVSAASSSSSSTSDTSNNTTILTSVCMQQHAIIGASVGTPFAAALMLVSFLLYKARRKSKRASIALGAQNLAAGRDADNASVYTSASTPLKPNMTMGVPPRVPPRPVSRLLPFSSETGAFGRRIS